MHAIEVATVGLQLRRPLLLIGETKRTGLPPITHRKLGDALTTDTGMLRRGSPTQTRHTTFGFLKIFTQYALLVRVEHLLWMLT